MFLLYNDTFYKADLSPFYLRGFPSPLLHIIYFIPWAGFSESARDSIFELGCVLYRPHLSSHNLHFYTWIQYVYSIIHVIILLQPSLPYYNKGSLVVTPFSPIIIIYLSSRSSYMLLGSKADILGCWYWKRLSDTQQSAALYFVWD